MAPLQMFDSIPKKLVSIAAIALFAICALPHSRAEHRSRETAVQPSALADLEPSLFLASGGLVPDNTPESVGVR